MKLKSTITILLCFCSLSLLGAEKPLSQEKVVVKDLLSENPFIFSENSFCSGNFPPDMVILRESGTTEDIPLSAIIAYVGSPEHFHPDDRVTIERYLNLFFSNDKTLTKFQFTTTSFVNLRGNLNLYIFNKRVS